VSAPEVKAYDLGELVRNGLVEKDGSEYFATDILMKGAAA
jgi:hypothetical protein